jgi:replicative DNA helicase
MASKATLHHDPAAEQGVVLCLMAAPQSGIMQVLQNNLSYRSFGELKYGVFVRLVQELFLQGHELSRHAITGRMLELVHAGKLSERDYEHLIVLWNSDGLSPDEITPHLKRVAVFDTMRRAVLATSRFEQQAREQPAKIQQLLPPLLVELSAIAEGATPEDPRMYAIIRRARPSRAIPSGFQSIDEMFGGWLRGTITTLAAPSEHGKSSVACSFTANLLAGNHAVLYITPELPQWVVAYRILCNLASISYREAEHGADNPAAEEARQAWIDVMHESLRIYEKVYTVADVIMRIRWHLQEFGERLALVIVDHLHFLRGLKEVGDMGAFRGNANSYWAAVMQRFVDCVKTHDLPLLLLSQLSLDVQRRLARDGDVDVLSFKEAGDIYDASDVAWLIRRDPDLPNQTIAYLKKNRLKGLHNKYAWRFDPEHYRVAG